MAGPGGGENLPRQSYKIKRVEFLGRTVPIICQNENGPCPLLAISNVLLLRNNIAIRGEPSEILLEDLMHLVADRLLDSNAETTDDEYGSNKRQNIEDAIQLLPRLATGIDVNVRFRNIHDFEFTRECAIFDLLDISIVHGWIIDPQDEPTCEIIGSRSYNTLVEKLVALKGLVPTADDMEASGGVADSYETKAEQVGPSSPSRSSESSLSGKTHSGQRSGRVDHRYQVEQNEDAALKEGMELSLFTASSCELRKSSNVEEHDLKAENCIAPSTVNAGAHNRAAENGNVVPSETHVEQGVDLHSAEAGRKEESGNSPGMGDEKSEMGCGTDGVSKEKEAICDEGNGPGGRDGACQDAEERSCNEKIAKLRSYPGNIAISGIEREEEEGSRGGGDSGEVVQRSQEDQGECTGVESPPQRSQEDQHECTGVESGYVGDEQTDTREGNDPAQESLRAFMLRREVMEEELNDMIKEGLVIENFLSNTASQLTYCGLFMLQEGVKERQLCVFFRNNHFNTMFKYNGQLYILATDQGYLNQSNLVWEKLSEVDGDTQFATGSFEVFKTDGNWAAAGYYVPRDGDHSHNRGGEHASPSQHDYDADLRLAWELHRREEQLMATGRDTSQVGANAHYKPPSHLNYHQGGTHGSIRPQREGQDAARGSSGSSTSAPTAAQTSGAGPSTLLPSSTSASSFFSKFSSNLQSKRQSVPRRGDTTPGSSSTGATKSGERKRDCVVM